MTRSILGEGDTPLLDITTHLSSELGGARISVKCEHLNPTGSFKDRIAAVAAGLATERGLRGLVGTSSGNGGAAAAAYSAHSGLRAILLALPDAPAAKLAQIRALGAEVYLVDGLGHDPDTTENVAAQVRELAEIHGYIPFLTGARFNPDIMAGAKSIAYELSAQRSTTTHVYAPVGGGGLVGSLWRGYRDLGGPPPRLVAVQPAGCPTLRPALEGRPGRLTSPARTGISGLQVAMLFDDDAAPGVTSSGGHLVEISDAQAHHAQALLARHGILVEPAGAVALAGALADAANGLLNPDDEIVLIASGAGWKDPVALARLAPAAPPAHRTIDDLTDILKDKA